ncbi:hypothetical protein [Carboxylicivirga sp. M1479]|uniref:hypothetical protein n=1 Tax=Carboxylicivirga sp. M1479 TaxID=2594476 RepID=UPI001177CC02|nr:hypothetical protein [Carboxylicivirga sp. M1479]TRX71505.1 hypothetical protein FNN09_05920 [Carboxylicivirga sp. M1479]
MIIKGGSNYPFFFNFKTIYNVANHYKLDSYNDIFELIVSTFTPNEIDATYIKKRLELLCVLTGKNNIIHRLNYLFNDNLIKEIIEEIEKSVDFKPKRKTDEEETDTDKFYLKDVIALAITQLKLDKKSLYELTPKEFFTAIELCNENQLNELALNYNFHTTTAFAVVKGYNSRIEYDKIFKNPYLVDDETFNKRKDETIEDRIQHIKDFEKMMNNR